MKEIIIYGIAIATTLWILGYSIHMLIGGLVSTELEQWIIAAACVIGAAIIAFMVYDVIKHRKKRGL